MKKVSIVIPVYNVETYLSQCLDSVLAQTAPCWEAILVDDGSTDASGQICDRYREMDDRFRVIHQKNGGAASAKNAGLDAVTGDYVAFMDSDDWIEPSLVETCVRAAGEYDADIVEFDLRKVYRSTSKVENSYQEAAHCFTAEDYLAQYLQNWTCSLFWNKLFRAEVLQSVRFRGERRCIDDEFFTYKAVSAAKRVVRINDVLYNYRQRASSAVGSSKNRLQITRDALDILIERYEWISERFPKLRRTYLCHDIEILFYIMGLAHDMQTVAAFKKTARYYMFQALKVGVGRISFINVFQLQFVSSKKLLKEKPAQAIEKNLREYFD